MVATAHTHLSRGQNVNSHSYLFSTKVKINENIRKIHPHTKGKKNKHPRERLQKMLRGESAEGLILNRLSTEHSQLLCIIYLTQEDTGKGQAGSRRTSAPLVTWVILVDTRIYKHTTQRYCMIRCHADYRGRMLNALVYLVNFLFLLWRF